MPRHWIGLFHAVFFFVFFLYLFQNVAALNELPITTEADLLQSGQQLRTTVAQVKQEQRMRADLLQMNAEERTRELRKLDAVRSV